MGPQNPIEIPTHKKLKLQVVLAGILIAILIFVLGIKIGDGSWKPNRIVNKASQQKGLPADLDYSSVEQAYDALKEDYDGELDSAKLMDGLKQGLAQSTGDPYTEYLSAEKAKEFDDELNGTFSGIGAELSKDQSAIVVVSPIAGFPAEKAGLKSKDIIFKINDEIATDLTISEAVNKIRGQVGTKVKLKVVRGGSQELDFEITREQITVPSVESEIIDGNIGYLKVSRFAEDTTDLAQQAALKFKQASVKGVILDLRNDPGGLLPASVDLASLWLPKGKLVLQERRGDTVIRTYESKGYATLQGIPTVVLINEGSASASEIAAGALKDNEAAKLIGVKSFGKGSVQQLARLPDGGVLKITIARWYTPNGKNIDKEGITPDQEVKRSDEDFKNDRDPQKDAAIQLLKK